MRKKVMTKKQMNKKKISLKLITGQTAIVLDYDVAMHIAETYDYLATEHKDEYSESFRAIADHIRYEANENYFNDSGDEYEDW
jgi:hypothetical protein